MRIDPNQPYLNNVNSDAIENKTTGATGGASVSGSSPVDGSPVEGGDTVELSATLAQAQQMQLQLAQTPEIRADRVNALRQQVSQGSYAPTNEQLAGAMISDIFGASGQS